jgi:hypothetical protein
MAAYEELSGLVGQKFQTVHLSEKPPKPVVQKFNAKVCKVPIAAFNDPVNFPSDL